MQRYATFLYERENWFVPAFVLSFISFLLEVDGWSSQLDDFL